MNSLLYNKLALKSPTFCPKSWKRTIPIGPLPCFHSPSITLSDFDKQGQVRAFMSQPCLAAGVGIPVSCRTGKPTFHWLSSVKISVSAKSTRFQVIASSSCLFQLSIPSVSLFLEAEWKLTVIRLTSLNSVFKVEKSSHWKSWNKFAVFP